MGAEDNGCRGDFAAMQDKPARPAGARMQVVYNPTAGRRRLRLLEDVLARLRSRGVDIVLHPTGARGDAARSLLDRDQGCTVAQSIVFRSMDREGNTPCTT